MRNLLCLLVVVTAATANPLFGDGLGGGGGDGGLKPGGGSFPFVVSSIYPSGDLNNHHIQCATDGK